MTLPKRYNPKTSEPALQDGWQESGVYHYDPAASGLRYTIDTPPPTVSGHLHLGHLYSYSQTDFMARFWRMNGYNVFYPMGFDDNGLPTGRLVERWEGIKAAEIGREAFVARCLAVSETMEETYRALWRRLGLSIDWRYTYRTIDERSRRISQRSFLELYRKNLAYRQQAPSIWCPECQTAIAQAELDDLHRETQFYTLDFRRPDGESLPIATTRPELLPACVAIFVHPDDGRFQSLIGHSITIPYFNRQVPLLADPGADPEKGTGAVMCCTFGDTADVEWWHRHKLPLIEIMGKDGRLTTPELAGMTAAEARQALVQKLDKAGLILDQETIDQAVRIHERCDTPVEYIITRQWFIRVLDHKEEFLAIGEQMAWHPPHMKARYRQWVENLGWDWCISRQRYFGVHFPIWYCADCGQTIVADEADLPVDPMATRPSTACPACGSNAFIPEQDVMDTWATSSMTPQIVGGWLQDEALYQQVYPMTLRPQAHEIIRTWAFYTIVKSHYHFNTIPFQTVAISGWALAPEGMGKISKSRGGGPIAPLEMIETYSADAVRYWAASTSLGKDAIISEEKVQAGAKLVTKLWHVARFSQRFLADYKPPASPPDELTLADRWILARTQQLIGRITLLFQGYDYATAKSEIEAFFWKALADNYLEMAKLRLYQQDGNGAQYALYHSLLTTIKLFAPLLPHITERIYIGLFVTDDGRASIHGSQWPRVNTNLLDEAAVSAGEMLVEIATAVRRYKSENNLSLGAELGQLHLSAEEAELANWLALGRADLMSITRAREVVINGRLPAGLQAISSIDSIQIAIR